MPSPPKQCPIEIAAPVDCGAFAEACGNATPIAAGANITFASGVAVNATDVYWNARSTDLAPCGGYIYRTPRTGGPSKQFAPTPLLHAFEVDDTTLYVVNEGNPILGFSTKDGGFNPIGAIDKGPSMDSYGLTKTPGGVVAFGDLGPFQPSFFRVTSDDVPPIAVGVGAQGYLGSVPAFDGASLFFSWMPEMTNNDRPLMRAEAGSSATTTLVPSATARMWPSVVVTGDSVVFITGDPQVDFGKITYPMGISRVSKAGGAPTVLLPADTLDIDQLLVDGTDVYFSASSLVTWPPGYRIQAVPLAGGTPRTVWTGTVHPDSLRLDSGSLYFALRVSQDQGEITGPGGLIVTVQASTSLE